MNAFYIQQLRHPFVVPPTFPSIVFSPFASRRERENFLWETLTNTHTHTWKSMKNQQQKLFPFAFRPRPAPFFNHKAVLQRRSLEKDVLDISVAKQPRSGIELEQQDIDFSASFSTKTAKLQGLLAGKCGNSSRLEPLTDFQTKRVA